MELVINTVKCENKTISKVKSKLMTDFMTISYDRL